MIVSFHSRFQLITVGFCAFLFRDAAAQNQPSYMQLSPTVKAVLYSPSPSFTARVAVVNMHEDGNRLSDIACTELVKRGFYVLCMNGRSDNNEALDFWNDLPMDVAARISNLLKGEISRFSIDKLINMLARAGLRVRLETKPRAA